MGRQIFEVPRAGEYFSIDELQAQTGQPVENFGAVVLKELVDNALDACENDSVPPEIVIQITGESIIGISVLDNASGIAPKTVERILNFHTRTSDKAAYRIPSRGAQGNAIKTVIGIPVALGCETPTIIESQNVQHTIRPRPDPAGNVTIDHHTKDNGCQGTQVIVTLPGDKQKLKPRYWARSFALFNPHAVIKISSFGNFFKQAYEDDKTHEIYHRTVTFPRGWRKFLPDAHTSIYWYSLDDLKRLIFLYIGDSRNGGRDLPLRDFVREFRQLSSSVRAKAVCDQFPTISRLSDFASQENIIRNLLEVMRRQSTPPSPQVLGKVGEDHLLRCLRGWHGVRRHWYKHVADQVNGIPFVFEFLIAETEKRGDIYHGVNFSPTYSDPLSGNPLSSPKFNANSLLDFLENGHASPKYWFEDGDPMTAAAMRLICPSLAYLDRGKTRLKLTEEMLERISSVLWRAVKTLHKEGEARRKDAARASRTILNRMNKDKYTHKEVVFHVLPEAISNATGKDKYPFSARNLFYQVRPLFRNYINEELDYNYFSPTLLDEYIAHNDGPIQGLYYDPRGVLYEPHTGKPIHIGTREVETYQFPNWLYNKMLYIEKKGLWPILEAAKLAEKYDMAVIASEGYATKAVRHLFENAYRNQGYQLFVLHDADPDGYNICRTLGEATRLMPQYQVSIIDLGLFIDEALELNLQTEEFTRRKALPRELDLSDSERKHFEGRQAGRKSWICERVELNAFSAPALITYIEEKLKKAGAYGKVFPSRGDLVANARIEFQDQLGREVDHYVSEILSLEDLKKEISEILAPDFSLSRGWVKEAFAKDPFISWRKAVQLKCSEIVSSRGQEIVSLLGAMLRDRH